MGFESLDAWIKIRAKMGITHTLTTMTTTTCAIEQGSNFNVYADPGLADCSLDVNVMTVSILDHVQTSLNMPVVAQCRRTTESLRS